MARRRSTRHYTFFNPPPGTQACAPNSNPDTSAYASLASCGPSGLNATRPGAKRQRPSSLALHPSPSRAPRRSRSEINASSTASPTSSHNLVDLPTDVLIRIAEMLEPRLSPYEPGPSAANAVPTLSSSWVDPGRDVMRFSSTCRAVWVAVRWIVRTRFGAEVKQAGVAVEEGGVRQRLSCITEDEAIEVQETDQALSFIKHISYAIVGSSIRHFYLHFSLLSTLSTLAGYQTHDTSCITLCLALPLMPRLESIAFVYASEYDVILFSPYTVAPIAPEIFVTLASTCRDLREIYLCGLRIMPSLPLRGEDDGALFSKALERITIAACHDSVLRLLASDVAPGLKEALVWREFTSPAMINPEGWWDEDRWMTVERADLKGFSGIGGRPLLDSWRTSLVNLRTRSPLFDVPLRALRILEAHHHHFLLTQIVPTVAHLPHLTSFSFIVWRTQNFTPAFIEKLAQYLPNLEDLGIGLENEALTWWPGNMTHFAQAFGLFPNLRSLTWNYTYYTDSTFAAARPFSFGPAHTIGAFCPNLRAIRWFGEAAYLCRDDREARWKWSDERELKVERLKTKLKKIRLGEKKAKTTRKKPRMAGRTMFPCTENTFVSKLMGLGKENEGFYGMGQSRAEDEDEEGEVDEATQWRGGEDEGDDGAPSASEAETDASEY